MNNLQSIQYFLPELLIVQLALSIIILDLLSLKRWVNICVYIGLGCSALLLCQLSSPIDGFHIFNGMLINDSFSYYFKWIILISTASIIVISNYSKELDREYSVEFNAMILFVLLGMFLMTNSIDLLMIYLSIELVSIPSYVLAGILKNDKKSNEASLKYVIFGSFASGLMLFGLSWLYGISGSTNIYDIYNSLALVESPYMIYISLMLILVGFGYKISMAPLHYWTPDVYEGSPTVVTAFFSVAPKAAGFAILIRTFSILFTDANSLSVNTFPIHNVNWSLVVAVLSAITMSIGNLLALKQDNVKRMLAYSTISHVGFMLMAFSTTSVEGNIGIMFYLAMYMFMNLSAFFMVIHVENNFNVKNIEDWSGIGYKSPVLSIFMVLSLVSLAGLPPTSGFVGKVYLFRTLFATEQFYWLGIVAILNSVISLYYYFKIVKSMYFSEKVIEEKENIQAPVYTLIVLFSAQNILFYMYWSDLYNYIKGLF
ncbi:MAG: NADH-quinone oxidoreductase subunit N [Candidatus Marinimicrobia bacterium]|nr:NADH-quinone oxidoreductase subunit N [Candidatus Neomarinimicrobiota bacterium]|tara:strand:+ start:4700 stop:6154 length:1455 start_codon:yes stop_codon:yes gene_type:complete